MVLILEKQGRAWVRLDRLTHQALAEIHAEMPYGTPVSTAQFAGFEPKLLDWKLANIKLADSRINDGRPPENVWELNAFGMAWAKNLPPLSRDKRTMPPLMPLADILADLPAPIREWLLGDPPIAKLPGGIMFEKLGVLILNHRGDAYLPTRELGLAADEYRHREQGGRSFTPETYVDLDISPDLAAFISAASVSPGVDARRTTFDGRQLRPWAATPEGSGVVLTVKDGDRTFYRLSHEMRALAVALASGERDGFKLAMLMPERFKVWVANSLSPALTPPMYDRLPSVIGLTKRKGKYDWKLTKAGEAVVAPLASALRAEEGVTVPDDEQYDGNGVDIVLPGANPFVLEGIIASDAPYQPLDQEFAEAEPDFDLGLDNPFDILSGMTGAPADPTARARAAEEGHVIEAPVPSNAELARARAEREARQPVADLSLDDEFDIL